MPQEPVGPIEITIGGKQRVFDIDDPDLPEWIERKETSAGDYPYDAPMKKKKYKKELQALQVELVKLQGWMQQTGERVVAIFEGRDAAGKGGTIKRVREYLNPRHARNVALPKPSETERGQWYFQRYVAQLPTAGEFVTFDRSWYNRAVVEPVMGFCTPAQHMAFLKQAPEFERMLVDDGVRFFKFWLNIGQETQLKRFHDRRHSPLKHWKFSPVDVAGMTKWDENSRARDLMFETTHRGHAPWTVIRANDKKRARIAAIRHMLRRIAYEGRDLDAIGDEDGRIIGEPDLLAS